MPNAWFACTWWRHQMGTFSGSLAICTGNSPVTGEFPTQRPVTRSFDVFVDLRLNKRLSKQSCGWWFETPSCPLWRHRNDKIYTKQKYFKSTKAKKTLTLIRSFRVDIWPTTTTRQSNSFDWNGALSIYKYDTSLWHMFCLSLFSMPHWSSLFDL